MADTPTVALTGATGFVGRRVHAQLLAGGHHVRVLVRDPDRLTQTNRNVHVVRGDLFTDAALEELMDGADAVIHVVGIIMERAGKGQTFQRIHTLGTQRMVRFADRAGVGRFIHMSALGSRPDAVSRYHQTKWQGEQAVRESGLAYTIFRPSIIHGPDGQFMQMVRHFWCGRFPPFVPYFAGGFRLRDLIEIKKCFLWPLACWKQGREPRYISTGQAGRLQPVYVEDVARCFVEALTNDKTVNETYPLGGPQALTWPDMFQAVRRHLPGARSKPIVAVPVWYAKLIAGKPGVPFNLDQVIMSQEDSICQTGKVRGDFGIELAPFEETFAEYASMMD